MKPHLEVAAKFYRAFYDWTSQGLPLRPKLLHSQIVALCEACEFRDGNTCGKCGCFFYVKAKLASESCPVGKWLATADATPEASVTKAVSGISRSDCCEKQ